MPLKLKEPRKGKSPYYSIRGTYLGIPVDRSCKTDRRSVAGAMLKRLQEEIERGEYPPKEAPPDRQQPTFLSAANAYMMAGRRRKYVGRLIKHFGETPLSEIDQAAIDAAAVAICPATTGGTRNACVYTPTSAILHHAGIELKIRRPKGAKGRVVTDWLSEPDAQAIILHADQIAIDFGLFLRFLLYTGLRLNEALKLRWEDFELDQSQVWVRRLKGGVASSVRLRPDLVSGLREHQPEEAQGRVFRFHAGGNLKHYLMRAKLAALGLPCPVRRPTGWRAPPHRLDWVNFHTFRHTWATWMRRAGADVLGLVATGNWRDARSAARYAHAVAREEWQRVDDLPGVENPGKVA
jgi:integrase